MQGLCKVYLPLSPEKNTERLKKIKAEIGMRKKKIPGYEQAFDKDVPKAIEPLKDAVENRMRAQFAQYNSPISPEEAEDMQKTCDICFQVSYGSLKRKL
jgi:hypothetical protein